MKKSISKTQAKEQIESFFKKDNFSSKEVRKIKRLAMKYNLKLTSYRRLFCKKCLSKLSGHLTVSKGYKIVKCGSCGFSNRVKI